MPRPRLANPGSSSRRLFSWSLALALLVSCGSDAPEGVGEAEEAGQAEMRAVAEADPEEVPEHRPATRAERLALQEEAQRVFAQAQGEASDAVEAARVRVGQKREALAEARAAADRALAEIESLEPELRAAEAELRSAEESLRELAAPPEPQVSDAELFRTVQRELLEAPALAMVAIAAEVDEGVVTLRGVVPDPETRDAAAQIASSVTGVRDLDNQVAVVSPLE